MGVFVQDLGIMDKKSRSRIGIIATVTWLPLAVIALSHFEGGISELIGMSILLIVSSRFLQQVEKYCKAMSLS